MDIKIIFAALELTFSSPKIRLPYDSFFRCSNPGHTH